LENFRHFGNFTIFDHFYDFLSLFRKCKIFFIAVINVAGGWCGGNASADNFVANVDLALKQSVWTSAISSHIAAKHLKTGGFFVLPGAAPVLDGATSGMIAYGASKVFSIFSIFTTMFRFYFEIFFIFSNNFPFFNDFFVLRF